MEKACHLGGRVHFRAFLIQYALINTCNIYNIQLKLQIMNLNGQSLLQGRARGTINKMDQTTIKQ